MRIRWVAVAALVLVLVGGLVVVLVGDRGPDSDAPGYVSGQSRWTTTFAVRGEQVLDDVIGLPEGTCFRWSQSGRRRADTSWRGSEADARVELSDPRLIQVSTRGELLEDCGTGRPLKNPGLYDVTSRLEIGGAGETTCDWSFSQREAVAIAGWCEGDEVTRSAVEQRVTVDTELQTRWGFELSQNPLRRWTGEATADGGGEDGFDAPLCFTMLPLWSFFVQRGDLAAITDFNSPRTRACVDLWEPTPWSDIGRS